MTMNSRRREERIPAKLPVRLWGMDANGKPFSVSATTVDVTRTGARIGNIPCQLQPGDIIGIQHGTEKARFRVAWIGKPDTVRSGQIGVVCAESNKYIWGAPLARLKAVADIEQRQSAFEQSPPAPEAPPLPQDISKTNAAERRDSTRYACTGGVEFKNARGGFKNWGTVSDVSDNGCYIETIFPLPAGTELELLINVRNVEIRCHAMVRSSHPNVGMGVEFLQLSPEDRQRLAELISILSIVRGNTQPLTAPTPTSTALGSPRATEIAPPKARPTPSDEIYKACTELRDAEALLDSSALEIEYRAISEFLRALEHARETTIAVQNWLDNHGGQDRFKLLAQRESARVRTVAALARELAVDVEACTLNAGSEGFETLFTAISQLHERLSELVGVVSSERKTD